MDTRIRSEIGLQSPQLGGCGINNMVNTCQGWGYRCVLTACAMSGAIAFWSDRALAQGVTSDGTLGTNVVETNVNTFDIRDGTTVDTNLFHSFGSFSVPDGGIANFQNATDIINIFGRVTGGTPSDIRGIIQAQGQANLFLINPSGIIFGSNAQLDIGGSFVGTTANAIGFPGGGEFSLTSPVDPNNSVLAVNPSALFFNQTPVGAIVNQSTLEVDPGQNLFLVGGDVTLNGGTVLAPGGRVELGGLAQPGVVSLDTLSNGDIGLGFPDGVAQADLSLTNTTVDVGTQDNPDLPGGDISITGNQLSIVSSEVVSRSTNASTSDFSEIQLTAQEGSILLNGSTLSTTNSDTAGLAGDIFVDAADGVFINGSSIFSNGRAGRIFIDARNQISVVNNSYLSTESNDENTEPFSEIRLTSQEGSILLNGSILNTTNSDTTGLAGDIFIDAADGVSIDGSSISSNGRAGRIFIDAHNQISIINNSYLSTQSNDDNTTELFSVIKLTVPEGSILVDQSELTTTNIGAGYAGDIGISASDEVSLTNSLIASNGNVGRILIGEFPFPNSDPDVEVSFSPQQVAIANTSLRTNNDASQADMDQSIPSGIISVDARDSISISDSDLQTFTNRMGDAGGVFLETNGGSISLDNSLVFSTVESEGRGAGGVIGIQTGSLSLSNRSELQTLIRAGGQGDAGLISIRADGEVSLIDRGRIFSTVETGATGNAGAIEMYVGSLSIRGDGNADQASGLTTSALGVGSPGYIIVEAEDDVFLRGAGSGIYSISGSESVNTDDRIGGILIDANSLFIRDEAAVSVDNQASGAAGVILVLADEDIILRDQGQISAIATSGEGGSIFLSSGDFLVLVNNSGISTQAGSPDRPGGINGGNITIDTRYLIAAPFSSNDLDAEAFEGPGGRIEIDANRLYDIEERSLSSLSNDISVTSGYGPPGEVTSNVLNTDPTQGLANLPANPIDPTTLIAETCAPIGSIEDREKNTFTVTERGGLPPDPNAAFPGEAAINDLETPAEGENTPDDPSSTNITTPTPVAAASPQEPEIVEAQGWMRGENGNIIFTAQAPVVTPNHSVRTPASTCHVSTSPQ